MHVVENCVCNRHEVETKRSGVLTVYMDMKTLQCAYWIHDKTGALKRTISSTERAARQRRVEWSYISNVPSNVRQIIVMKDAWSKVTNMASCDCSSLDV